MSTAQGWGLVVMGCGLTMLLPELVDRVRHRRRTFITGDLWEWERQYLAEIHEKIRRHRLARLQRTIAEFWLLVAICVLVGPPLARWLDRADGDTVGALAYVAVGTGLTVWASVVYHRRVSAACGDATCTEAHP